jgi:hypothetical protein
MLETIIVRASASAVCGHRQELLAIKLSLRQGVQASSTPPHMLCEDAIGSCLLICCPHATANFSDNCWKVNMWQRSSGRDLETDSRLSLMCRKIVKTLAMAWHAVA